jgi:hypothetical protein
MISMSDYLTQAGVTDHRGWLLLRAVYVSPDGRVIAGYGQKTGRGTEPQIVDRDASVTAYKRTG